MNLSVPEYVNNALKWLADEKRWGQKYYRLSYKAVIKQVEYEIINLVAENLANNNESGVLDMLKKGKK